MSVNHRVHHLQEVADMKHSTKVVFGNIVFLFPLLVLAGCYTQMAPVRDDRDAGYPPDNGQYEQSSADSTQVADYDTARQRFYDESYYPAYCPTFSVGYDWPYPYYGYYYPWYYYDPFFYGAYYPYWYPHGGIGYHGGYYYGGGRYYGYRGFGNARTTGAFRTGYAGTGTTVSRPPVTGRSAVQGVAPARVGTRTVHRAAILQRSGRAARVASSPRYGPSRGAQGAARGGRGYAPAPGGRGAPMSTGRAGGGARAGGGGRGGGRR